MQIPATFYNHVKVDIPDELMRHVIGKNGRFFKEIAIQAGVNYIWYNKTRHIVEIWGIMDNLVKAAFRVQTRIHFIKERFTTPEQLSSYKEHLHWDNDEYCEYDLNNDEREFEKGYMDLLIGREGKHFKWITRMSGSSFLWYNNQKHCIQIWAPQENLNKTIELLNKHVNHVDKRVKELINNYPLTEVVFSQVDATNLQLSPDDVMNDIHIT